MRGTTSTSSTTWSTPYPTATATPSIRTSTRTSTSSLAIDHRRRTASRSTDRPVPPFLFRLDRNPKVAKLPPNVDPDPALATLGRRERGDDGTFGGIEGDELEESTGFGADDVEAFDGPESLGEGDGEGLVGDGICYAL